MLNVFSRRTVRSIAAFTLMEVAVALGIVALATTVAVISYRGYRDWGKAGVNTADLSTLNQAVEIVRWENPENAALVGANDAAHHAAVLNAIRTSKNGHLKNYIIDPAAVTSTGSGQSFRFTSYASGSAAVAIVEDGETSTPPDGSLGVDLDDVVLNARMLSSLVGGSSGSLDNLVTADLPAGRRLVMGVSGQQYLYELVSGTAPTSEPDVVRPVDYNPTTNPKVWVLRRFYNTMAGANNLSEITDPSVARNRLGLKSMATQDAASVAILGGTAILDAGGLQVGNQLITMPDGSVLVNGGLSGGGNAQFQVLAGDSNIGAGISLVAPSGGTDYTLRTTGTQSGLGAGYFSIYDATNGADRIIIAPTGAVHIPNSLRVTTLTVDDSVDLPAGSVTIDGEPLEDLFVRKVGDTMTGNLTTSGILDGQAGVRVNGVNVVTQTRNLIAGTGLVGGGDLSADRTFALATTGLVAGTYGSQTQIPVITADVYGRITGISLQTVTAAGVGAVSDDATISFSSSNGVVITPSSATLASSPSFVISTPQDLRATAAPTFSALTSTVATGTAPFTVSSTTVVGNLNADLLDGQHRAYFENAGNLNAGTLPVARLPAFTGDATTVAGSSAITLANSGVTAGAYTKVTVDAKGRVTSGSSLASSDVVSALGYTPVSKDATFLGSVGNTTLDGVTNTAAAWANLPVGYSRFMGSGIGTAGGAPISNYGYFTKVGNRDTNGGWGGLWVGYAAGENFVGRAATNGGFASWDRLFSSAYLPTGVQNGAITNAMMANAPTLTVKGNASAGSAAPADLTMAQLKTMLALTASDINGVDGYYLPLTGGTLTGALGGTTASFSGTVSVANLHALNGYVRTGSDGKLIYLRTLLGYNRIDSYNSALDTTTPLLINASEMLLQSADVTKIHIDGSSVTLSVPVVGTSAQFNSLRVGVATSTLTAEVKLSDSAGADKFRLTNSGGANVFTVDSAGNVTFGGNVATFNMANGNLTAVNNILIAEPGPGEGLMFGSTAAGWSIDVSPLNRSNADGNLNLYGTSGNIAAWRPILGLYSSTTYATLTPTSTGGLAMTSTGTGGFSVSNGITAGGDIASTGGRVSIGTAGVSDTDTFLTLFPQVAGNSIYHLSNYNGALRFSRGAVGSETTHDMALSSAGLNVSSGVTAGGVVAGSGLKATGLLNIATLGTDASGNLVDSTSGQDARYVQQAGDAMTGRLQINIASGLNGGSHLWIDTSTSIGNSTHAAVGQVQISPVPGAPGILGVGRRQNATITNAGGLLGELVFNGTGTDGASWTRGALISAIAQSNSWGDGTNTKTDLAFYVNTGTGGLAEVMRLANDRTANIKVPLNVLISPVSGGGGTPANTSVQIISGSDNFLTFSNTADSGTWAGTLFNDNFVAGYVAYRHSNDDRLYLGAINGIRLQVDSNVAVGGKTTIVDVNSTGATITGNLTVTGSIYGALSALQITNGLGYTPTRAVGSFTNSVVSADTRATHELPADRNPGLFVDFKQNSTTGLSDGGSYHGMLTFRPYGNASDFSAGYPMQIGFTNSGNLWTRIGTSATSWGSWTKVLTQANLTGADIINALGYTPISGGSYLPLAGGTLTGGLTGTTANFTSTLTVGGLITANGGAKISVQDGIDGGSSRGLFMWNEGDTAWGIYMASAGANKSLAGNTAVGGFDGRTGYAIRHRALNNAGHIGFLWENSTNVALMQLQPDTGNLYLKGLLTGQGGLTVTSGQVSANFPYPTIHVGNGAGQWGGYAITGNNGTMVMHYGGQGQELRFGRYNTNFGTWVENPVVFDLSSGAANFKGRVTAQNFSSGSSIRWKENVETITDALGMLHRLRGVTWDYRRSYRPEGGHDIGFIAEEIGEVIPEIVGRDADGRPNSVDYSRVTPVLVEATQEIDHKLDGEIALRTVKDREIDQKLAALAASVESVRAENRSLRNQVSTLRSSTKSRLPDLAIVLLLANTGVIVWLLLRGPRRNEKAS